MEALRRQGYDIEARTGKGYRLLQSPDLLRQDTLAHYLTEQRENWQVLESVDSTNSACRRLALEGAPDGTVVLADCQTAGRGGVGGGGPAARRGGGAAAFRPRRARGCRSPSCGGPTAPRSGFCP